MHETDQPVEGLPELGFWGRILLRLSNIRPKVTGSEAEPGEDPLALLQEVYPDLLSDIEGKRVLDFGCGAGRQAVAMAKATRAEVVGVDIQQDLLVQARQLANDEGASNVTFLNRLEPGEKFDWVVSQNSMEHFSRPEQVLRLMAGLLKPDGRILITFCPTWLSPYGAHMHFFTPIPWVHLLFPEDVVMAVRARFRSDGAMRYEEVPGGLNKMTVSKYRRLVGNVRLQVVFEKLEYVRNLAVLGEFPPTREFFTNRMTQVLRLADEEEWSSRNSG